MNVGFDPSGIEDVRKETKTKLLRWKLQWKPSSPQHIAANVELVRRDDLPYTYHYNSFYL